MAEAGMAAPERRAVRTARAAWRRRPSGGLLVAAVAGYGLGSVMVAPWLARRHGVDLYATADGNPGAWNALEQLGPRGAAPVFVGDGAKAALAAGLGRRVAGPAGGWVGAAGAIVGHGFPAGRPGQGGKGVMCLVGGMLVLAPEPWWTCLGICLGVSRRRGFASGAAAAITALPFVEVALVPIEDVAATGALMSLMGALFLSRRRSRVPASSAAAPAPRG